LWLVLAKCYRALNQVAERSIEETGLGLTDFAALEALLHKGPLTITEIHGKVPLALGSMTAAVDRLEEGPHYPDRGEGGQASETPEVNSRRKARCRKCLQPPCRGA